MIKNGWRSILNQSIAGVNLLAAGMVSLTFSICGIAIPLSFGNRSGNDRDILLIVFLPFLATLPLFVLIVGFFRRHAATMWLLAPLQWIMVAALSLMGLAPRAAALLKLHSAWQLLAFSIAFWVPALHLRQGVTLFRDQPQSATIPPIQQV